ncbi:hypothetical protein GCM10027049_21320 [Mucilaginibacter puniceus]
MKKELLFSLIGYVCLLIVGWVAGLWIYIADYTRPYEEVKQEYYSYFPAALANGTLLCFISIVIAAIGLFCVTVANKHLTSKPWITINTVVTVLLGLILFLNVWSLM